MSNVPGNALDSLLADLTEPQLEAVRHVDGPLLVLAGAGSGKTRVITRRAAYLACVAAHPRHILAITFTNKAAQEMRERIEALGTGSGLTACTFHAFCARTLRIHCGPAGDAVRHGGRTLQPNFTIFDRADRRKVIKEAIEACDLSTTNWAPARVDAAIGRAKNRLETVDEFEAKEDGWQNRTIARIYRAYQGLLDRYNALDFDDLLMRVALLLNRDEGLRQRLEDRYRYVLIDEYQDTNAAQYQIARLLTRERHNLCATGDPDQSIYGWRGANIGNILSFEHDYPDARVVRLEQNYRSTKRILSAAGALIARNTSRKEKTLWTENEEGAAIRVIECESGDSEAAWIAEDIAGRLDSGGDGKTEGEGKDDLCSPRDVAIFYRVNAQSRALEEALLRRGIAYQIVRGLEFYARKEIKDTLAYLNVLLNPSDEVSLLRIINTPPRGIGATSVARLHESASRAEGKDNLRGYSKDDLCSPLYDVIVGGGDHAGIGRSAGKVRVFGELLTSLLAAVELPPHEAIERVVSLTGLRAMYGAQEAVDRDPLANIDELISAAGEYEQMFPGATLQEWLEHTSLLSDVDGLQDELGAVTLMTLHAAKGLEFPHVYIVGLEDGMLPLRRRDCDPGDDDADTEEERRLCFVGMTRAKKRLTLCHARYRMLRGITERKARSPFLDELPRDEIEWDEADAASAPKPCGFSPRGVSAQAKACGLDHGELPDDIDKWSVGTLVRHPRHGLGKIVSLCRGARRTHVDVYFEDGATRTWVLEFAQLERVDYYDVG